MMHGRRTRYPGRTAIALTALAAATTFSCSPPDAVPDPEHTHPRPANWSTRWTDPEDFVSADPSPADDAGDAPSPASRSGASPSPWDISPTVVARKWRYIVIHHSATDEGSAAAFRRYHRRRGWDDLAYHFVIGNGHGTPDGAVEVGMRWTRQKVGAHAGNKEYNYFGIGICLVGNFEAARPTARQIASLRKLLKYLMERYDIPRERIVRHCEIVSTKCPGRRFPWPVLP